jgi:hypothetical protein
MGLFSKRIALQAIAAAALVAVAGCAAPVRLGTPSGGPEVMIPGVQKKQVADRLVGNMVSGGFQVRTVNEYMLTFGKPAESVMVRALFGSGFNGVPEIRHEYSLVEVPAGVRVLGRIKVVTNPGSGLEKAEDFTQQLAAEQQRGLEGLAASFR